MSSVGYPGVPEAPMEEAGFHNSPFERVFRVRRSAPWSAGLWLAGGIVALVFAGVGFAVSLVSRADPLAMQLMTTMPALLGIGALAGAWTTVNTPREVRVGPGGVRVEDDRRAVGFDWEHLGWSSVETAPLNNRRVLCLYGTDGRTLVRLSDALEPFDELVEAVAAGIAAKGDDTAAHIQAVKARRSAVFMATGGVAFLALSIAVAGMTSREIRAARLLKTAAVPGVARIEKRFLAPNGVTPRLVYRVTTPDGRSATRNAEVARPVWDSLDGAPTVPVVYVPEDPSISRLAFGEPPNRDSTRQPLVGYGMPALVALMSLFFLGCAALMWRGWDIDLDSKTGRLSIKRFGTGR